MAPLEQTAELQAQIDRLSLALHQWRETQDHLQPMEQRLLQLTERCAEILNRWADTDQRHASVVSEIEYRLSEWGAIEGRLQQDSLQRIRELEGRIEHEWKALRQIHEEPVNRLREQAEALGETCMAAANLALRGFERAEARFVALEADLQGRLNQLSQDVQAALAESRREGLRPTSLGGGVAPFPLEGIARIHDGLREAASGTDSPAVARRMQAVRAEPAEVITLEARQLPEAAATLAGRVDSLEREFTSEKREVRETATLAEHLRRNWRVGIGVLVVAALITGVFAVRLQQRVNARLDDATARAAAAERQAATATDAAARQIAATRADAERQIADARQSAAQAQIVGNVLAAPDLMRFNLTGVESAPRAYALVLWSRSRGLVLSASLMPAVPAGMTYQVWLLTNQAVVSGGVFVPDSSGRAMFTTETLSKVPRPVTGVIVTLESAGGQSSPSGVGVLARAPQ